MSTQLCYRPPKSLLASPSASLNCVYFSNNGNFFNILWFLTVKTASCVSPCQNLTNVANCVVQWDFVGSWRNIKMLRQFAKVSQRSHWINLLISSSTYFITSAFFKECSYCQWKLAPRIWKQEDLTREPESQNYGLCVKRSVKKQTSEKLPLPLYKHRPLLHQ